MLALATLMVNQWLLLLRWNAAAHIGTLDVGQYSLGFKLMSLLLLKCAIKTLV